MINDDTLAFCDIKKTDFCWLFFFFFYIFDLYMDNAKIGNDIDFFRGISVVVVWACTAIKNFIAESGALVI